jgi:superfamily I DNA/RNA helicase
MTALIENIDRWESKEISKIENDPKKRNSADDLIETVRDKGAILRALCDGLTNPAELITRLDTMFGDSEDDRRPAVVCSSIHKSKGLEAHRVFVLKNTLYPQRKRIGKNGVPIQVSKAAELEEANLEYVACTRAIEKLVWVA